MKPKLIVHGGAGLQESTAVKQESYHKALAEIAGDTYIRLENEGARGAVLYGIRRFEGNRIFNAGTGSRLQRDGQARMSAALVDSQSRNFSGVINICNVEHPIDVADILESREHKVLCGDEASEFAWQEKIQYYDPITKERLFEHVEKLRGDSGTVGVVALDEEGRICAGTSTGGIGFETPGRVADSATVAGTFASEVAGVSCTGRGEHIVNLAAAARIVAYMEAGLGLAESVNRLLGKARQAEARFGLIALDCFGNFAVASTARIKVLYAKNDGKRTETFYQR